MPIVWTKADGTVRLMRLSPRYLAENRLPDETTVQVVLRLSVSEQAKNPDLADATAFLVTEANVPVDRAKRHKWRLQGSRCVVDDSVPDPVHPRQSLLDQINAAATLDQVKQSMVDWVRMRG